MPFCAAISCRYHGHACAAGPRRSDGLAAKPKRSRARVTSSCRRGWPLGCAGVPDDAPGEAGGLGDQRAPGRVIEISTPLPRFTGSLRVVALGAPARCPRPHPRRTGTRASGCRRPTARSRPCPSSRASRHLRIIAGMTCEVCEIEVVARPVEVHREQHDAVHAVLRAVRLRLHEQQLLGDAVRRVGLLGIAVPQVVFAERDRRELGVGADGAGDDRLCRRPRGGTPRCRLQAHHHVVEQKQAGVVAVGADAADARGQVEHQVGARCRPAAGGTRRDRPDRSRGGAGTKMSLHPARAQRLDHEAAEEAGAAGDQDPATHQGRRRWGRRRRRRRGHRRSVYTGPRPAAKAWRFCPALPRARNGARDAPV